MTKHGIFGATTSVFPCDTSITVLLYGLYTAAKFAILAKKLLTNLCLKNGSGGTTSPVSRQSKR